MKGTLYLIPSPIGGEAVGDSIPLGTQSILSKLKYFVVEELRTTRRFLKKVNRDIDIDVLNFQLLNEHTAEADIAMMIQPALEGEDIGLISEAGLPCVADPGSRLVEIAHQKKVRVVPMVGPSSIMLALMASGFNGQQFTFHGYLPVEPGPRNTKIRELEKSAKRLDQTQIFIETPYRNLRLLEALISNCHPDTMLCIAAGIGDEYETIISSTIREWKTKKPELHKVPAVFLLY